MVRGYGWVVLAALLFGAGGLYARSLAALDVSPSVAALWRVTLGFVAALAWRAALRGRRAALQGRPAPPRRRTPPHLPGAVPRRRWGLPGPAPGLLVVTGVAIGLLGLAYLHSMVLNPLAVAALLLYTSPAMVAAGGRFWLGEPLTLPKAGALAGALSGVALMALPGAGGGRLTAAGLLVGLGAGLALAAYGLAARAAGRHYPPETTVVWGHGVAALVLAVLLLPVVGGGAFRMPGTAWLLVAALAVLHTFLPYVLYTRALVTVPASNASIVALVEPVSTGLWGYLFYAERLGPAEVAGAALILGAAAVAVRATAAGDRAAPAGPAAPEAGGMAAPPTAPPR